MCTNVMYVDIVNRFLFFFFNFFYLFHEVANILFFSHLLTRVYMGNWATLSVVLAALYVT